MAQSCVHGLVGARQERVKTCQGAVNIGSTYGQRAFTEDVTENIVAGLIAIALIGYLVYALARPDKL